MRVVAQLKHLMNGIGASGAIGTMCTWPRQVHRRVVIQESVCIPKWKAIARNQIKPTLGQVECTNLSLIMPSEIGESNASVALADLIGRIY